MILESFLTLEAENMQPIIQLRNLSFQYKNAERVLNNLTTNLFEGQFITILGPNGSGKSTLAKCLNGILHPTDGVVIVDQIDTKNEDLIWHIRQHVGVVFQNPDNQIVASTVEEDVAFGLENQGIESSEMAKRVEDALQKVNLEEYKHTEPHHLSGGQKQKVAIAGIIAMKPKVIIFDEATSMLDPIGRAEVLKVAKQLNEEEGITILHITHFVQEALLADRILIMDRGYIIADGSPKEILSKKDLLEETGLDVPIAVDLAHRLKEKGYSFHTDLVREEEFIEALWTLR